MEDIVIINAVAKELLDKASKITMTNYSDYTLGCLVSALDDLILEIEDLNEQIDELNQDIEENYRHISRTEEIGYNPYDYL